MLKVRNFTITFIGVALLAAAPAAGAHDSHPWPAGPCAPGETLDCWHTVPSLAAPMIDSIASGDASHDSNPQPRNGDLYSGPDGTLPTVYYAYDDHGTPDDPNDDFVFFRMRLDGTPTLAVNGGSSPPWSAATGPFSSNTAWNFILDLNGDGWADFAASTDGNTGKQQDGDDTYRLTYINTPGNQLVTNDSACVEGGGGGQVLFLHKAIDRDFSDNDPGYTSECLTQTAESCDFGFTRVVNEAPPAAPTTSNNDENFFLDMQFPLASFDDCSSVGTDDDSGVGTTLINSSFVPGEQLLTPTTPFTLCVTTSTQPNDFTNKDIAYDGTFRMRADQPLPCGEPCTLAGGCDPTPLLIDITEQCGAGTNSSPVTLTATLMDAAAVSGAGSVIDTMAHVEFLVMQEGGTTWSAATAAPGSTNPVVTPVAGTLNQWRLQWDTSAVSTSPTSVYLVRVIATDDQGHQHDSSPIKMTLAPNSACGASNNPITLASFTARRSAEGTVFEWTTETEAGNAGFNLYAETGRGWRRINGELIPSLAIDSTAPLTYRFEAPGAAGGRFAIEDVDVRGRAVLHGPYEADRLYGERPRPEAIDWAAVHQQRATTARGAALGHRTAAARGGKGGPPAGGGSPAPSVDLLVDRDGVYRVTSDQLAAAGFDFSAVASASLAVTSGGRPVPVRVVAGSHFGPGAWLEFVGEALDTLYTDTNVYTLTADAANARRVGVDTAAPPAAPPVTTYRETVRIEADRRYSFASPIADPWYDTTLSTGRTPRSWHFDLPVDGYVPGAGPATLAVEVWGVTDSTRNPDHHVRAALNGLPVADVQFNGITPHTLAASVPDGTLAEGINRLTLELPGDTGTPNDLVSLDSYAVTYPRELAARGGELA
ncbi:MAG TPA: hypothetical protein VHQ65_06980, partial [Thermoanaerobaculia bacterium]|nr:hypothetical protein [Thermoanaerobaculia bacterium]